MKRVLLDVDGVLADFVGAYLKILWNELGIEAHRNQIATWDIAAALGLTKDQASIVKRAIGKEAGLAGRLDVYDGAVQGVKRLQEVADVYIVTSPWNSNPTWTHDRERWLWERFGIPSKRVIHTSAKHIVSGDVFVDDKLSAVEAWRAHNPRSCAVLWSTPHNSLDPWDGQCTCDWAMLCELATMQVAA